MARTRSRASRTGSGIGIALVLLAALALLLTLGGGASRADLLAQSVMRGGALAALALAVLTVPALPGGEAWRRAAPVALLLGGAILLVALQLLPLPPALWQALPGRAPFAAAATLAGTPQPWRPLSLAPSATVNALGSLAVPLAVLGLVLCLRGEERRLLPALLLAQITLVALIGVLQASGFDLDVPLADLAPGEVSGSFSNRNHFAVFMALGCLVAPSWALLDPRGMAWRAPVALGLALVFLLLILASGSRVGLAAGGIALLFGALSVRRGLRALAGRLPRWVAPALLGGALLLVAGMVAVSIGARRAASVERVATLSLGEDLRSRSFSTVTGMTAHYFPAGTGFGSFDPMFRLHEPDRLLRLTYFNHAHDDVLEVVLDGGLPAAVLLIAGLGWWLVASWRGWRAPAEAAGAALAPLGSAMVLVLLVASLFDYPLRTPLMMEALVLAGLWLCPPGAAAARSAVERRAIA